MILVLFLVLIYHILCNQTIFSFPKQFHTITQFHTIPHHGVPCARIQWWSLFVGVWSLALNPYTMFGGEFSSKPGSSRGGIISKSMMQPFDCCAFCLSCALCLHPCLSFLPWPLYILRLLLQFLKKISNPTQSKALLFHFVPLMKRIAPPPNSNSEGYTVLRS